LQLINFQESKRIVTDQVFDHYFPKRRFETQSAILTFSALSDVRISAPQTYLFAGIRSFDVSLSLRFFGAHHKLFADLV
jgi:hypothetical protein